MTLDSGISNSGLGRLLRNQTAIDFYAKRKVGLILAVLAAVVTLGSLLTQGLNLGLDFEGGDAWDIPSGETFGVDEAIEVLKANDVSTSGARIQLRSSDTVDVVTVQVEVLPRAQADAVTADFAQAAGVTVDEISFSFTSSTWGAEITEKAIRALVVFLLVVGVFISVRFEWRMAVSGIAATINDVIVAVGVYSVFQFEVTPATVIAFLTILGYSLYDTIVVFDRVKENEGRYASTKMPYEDIVNISMNQVLVRSLLTSFSSILPVISLLILGSGVLGAVALREFALALLIGMISGVYSSIFIATPLLASLKSKSVTASRRRPLQGDDLRAAVMGAGITGRVIFEDAGAAPVSDTSEQGGNAEREPATAGAGTTSGAATHSQADRLLTHPPRPRKKKRR
jgi:preprotein translocase subunit SecF